MTMTGGGAKNTLGTVMSALAVIAIGLFCISLVWGSWTRTFLVEARSFGATLTFRGNANAWELEQAALCRERAAPVLVADGDAALCPAAAFSVTGPDPRTIAWPDKAEVRLRLQPDNSLMIEGVSGTEPALAEGDRLVVPAETWRRHGALVVNGSITFGGGIAPGANDYLVSGRWEARQESLASSMFRPTMEIVKQGELSRGASAEIWRGGWLWGLFAEGRPATVYGHVTPSFDSDTPGMVLSALSETSRVEMHLRYYGLEAFAVIRPDALDTIMTSPVLLAAAAVLGVLALILDVGKSLRGDGSAGRPTVTWFRRWLSRRE